MCCRIYSYSFAAFITSPKFCLVLTSSISISQKSFFTFSSSYLQLSLPNSALAQLILADTRHYSFSLLIFYNSRTSFQRSRTFFSSSSFVIFPTTPNFDMISPYSNIFSIIPLISPFENTKDDFSYTGSFYFPFSLAMCFLSSNNSVTISSNSYFMEFQSSVIFYNSDATKFKRSYTDHLLPSIQ